MIDILQSATIIIWGLTTIFIARRVGRLDNRLDLNSTAIAQLREEVREQDPQPVCGCSHHQCFHDEHGCGHEQKAYDSYNGGWGILKCGCKRYTGPEPLPQVIP